MPGISGSVVCGHNGDGSWYPDGPYSAGQVAATSGDGGAVAWLLDHYAATTDPTTAAAIDAINSRYGSNDGGLDDYNIAIGAGLGGTINTLLAGGRDNAGPYAVSITGLVTAATGHFNTTYTAAVHVRSASGSPITGKVVTLTGHGAHLFTSSVTTNRAGDASFQYSVPSSVPSPNFTIDAATTVPVLMRYSYLGPSAPHMPQDVVGFQHPAGEDQRRRRGQPLPVQSDLHQVHGRLPGVDAGAGRRVHDQGGLTGSVGLLSAVAPDGLSARWCRQP